MPLPKNLAASLCIGVALVSCAPKAPAPEPSSSPSAVATTPAPGPTLTPAATASSQPKASATPIASPSPSPTASPPPVIASPDARPQILRVQMSSTTVSPGDEISGLVTTTSNVASIEARIASYSLVVPKTGIGLFTLTYRVPDVPFFLRGNYTIVLIARNTRGDRTTRQVPIVVH